VQVRKPLSLALTYLVLGLNFLIIGGSGAGTYTREDIQNGRSRLDTRYEQLEEMLKKLTVHQSECPEGYASINDVFNVGKEQYCRIQSEQTRLAHSIHKAIRTKYKDANIRFGWIANERLLYFFHPSDPEQDCNTPYYLQRNKQGEIFVAKADGSYGKQLIKHASRELHKMFDLYEANKSFYDEFCYIPTINLQDIEQYVKISKSKIEMESISILDGASFKLSFLSGAPARDMTISVGKLFPEIDMEPERYYSLKGVARDNFSNLIKNMYVEIDKLPNHLREPVEIARKAAEARTKLRANRRSAFCHPLKSARHPVKTIRSMFKADI